MIFLIDTNIIIDHLRGEPVATEFLLSIEDGRAQGCVSVLTEYELLAVPRLTRYQATEISRLLTMMPHLAVTSRIARLAAEFHRHYHTTIADALIAATARLRRATLVTRNVKHFQPIKALRLHTL